MTTFTLYMDGEWYTICDVCADGEWADDPSLTEESTTASISMRCSCCCGDFAGACQSCIVDGKL